MSILTPKQIANKIKAKGLQKLRWYCQMCEKQCRDENGFKCHATSESHLRKMAEFRDHPNSFVDDFSKEFEDSFMDILRRRGRVRQRANTLYQEMVGDRQHVHMNSTKWDSLTSFILYLGRSGKAEIDEVEGKGWYVKYIDYDPAAKERKKKAERMESSKRDLEELEAERLQKQIELARAAEEKKKGLAPIEEGAEASTEESSSVPFTGEISLVMNASSEASFSSTSTSFSSSSSSSLKKAPVKLAFNALASLSAKSSQSEARVSLPMSLSSSSSSSSDVGQKRKISAVEQVLLDEERRKREKLERDEREKEALLREKRIHEDQKSRSSVNVKAWIAPGIIVKVVDKQLADGNYYKQKAVVKKVDGLVADIKMLDSGDLVRIDQRDLETVIPALGREVLVVLGEHKGMEAILIHLNNDKCFALVDIKNGPSSIRVNFDDISKLY